MREIVVKKIDFWTETISDSSQHTEGFHDPIRLSTIDFICHRSILNEKYFFFGKKSVPPAREG